MFAQGHSSTAMNPSILTLVWMSILVTLVQTVFADDVIMQKRVNYHTHYYNTFMTFYKLKNIFMYRVIF